MVFYKKREESKSSGEWKSLISAGKVSSSFLQLAVAHLFFCLWCLFWHFERNISQDQLWPCLMCRQVLHLHPSIKPQQVEHREKPSLPMELVGCTGWGRWGDVINAAGTLLQQSKFLRGAGRCPSQDLLLWEAALLVRVRAACRAQPSPQWAAEHSLGAFCSAFLSRTTFSFNELVLFN